MAYIYGLIDPITSELRYIGYTANSIEFRGNGHWRERKRGKTHKNNWINKLWDDYKVKPEVFQIEEILESEWVEAECFWIDYFRSIGCNLTNNSLGGRGRIKGTKLDSVHKSKISAGLKLASAEGRFNYKAAGEKRRGKPTWNKGKTYNKSEEAMSRYMENPNRARPNNKSGEDHSRTQTLTFVSPTGIIETWIGKGKFCKEYNLNPYSLNKLMRGEIDSYKGWTLSIRTTLN